MKKYHLFFLFISVITLLSDNGGIVILPWEW